MDFFWKYIFYIFVSHIFLFLDAQSGCYCNALVLRIMISLAIKVSQFLILRTVRVEKNYTDFFLSMGQPCLWDLK